MSPKTSSLRSPPVSKSLDVSLRSLRSVSVTATLEAARSGAFVVFRGYEGDQLVINWPRAESGADMIQIRRKLYDWPQSVADAVLIVEDEAPFSIFEYSDRELESYQVYYYQMFIRRLDGVWYTDNSLRGKEFPVPTGYFEKALWSRLPPLYPKEDGEN